MHTVLQKQTMLPAFAVFFSVWALSADVVEVNLTCVWGSNPRQNLSSPPKALKCNLHTPKEAAIVNLRRARAYTLALRWLWTDLQCCVFSFEKTWKGQTGDHQISKYLLETSVGEFDPFLHTLNLFTDSFSDFFCRFTCYDVNIVTVHSFYSRSRERKRFICLKDSFINIGAFMNISQLTSYFSQTLVMR